MVDGQVHLKDLVVGLCDFKRRRRLPSIATLLQSCGQCCSEHILPAGGRSRSEKPNTTCDFKYADNLLCLLSPPLTYVPS